MDSPESDKCKDVRRPMNAFLIFCKRHRSIVRERNPHLDNRSVTRMLGELWAELGEEEKVVYTDLAKQYKDAFMKAHPDFKWHGTDKCALSGHDGAKPPHHPPAVAKLFKVQIPTPVGDHIIVPGKLADPTQMGGLNQLLMAGQQGSIATTSVTMTTNVTTMVPSSITTGSTTCAKSALLVSSPLGKKNISSFQYILPKEAASASTMFESQVLSQRVKQHEMIEPLPVGSRVSQKTTTKINDNLVTGSQFDINSMSPKSSKSHNQLSGPVLWSQFPVTQTQSTNQQSDINSTKKKRQHSSPRIPGGQSLGKNDNRGQAVTAGMTQSGLLQLAEMCSSELSQGGQQLLSPKLSSSSLSSPLSSSAKCHQMLSGQKTLKPNSSSCSLPPSINNKSISKGPNRQANKLLYSLIAENPVDCYTFTGDEDEDDTPSKLEKPFRHKVGSSCGKMAPASFGGGSEDVALYNDLHRKGVSKSFNTQHQNLPVLSDTAGSTDTRWSVDQTDRTLVTCGKMVVDHIIDRLFSRDLASQGQKSFVDQFQSSFNQNIELANFFKMEKIEEVEAALKEKLGNLNYKYPKSIGDYVTRVISDAYSKVQHDAKNENVSSSSMGLLSASSSLIPSSADKPVSGPGRDKKLKALLQQCGSDSSMFISSESATCVRMDDNITSQSHRPQSATVLNTCNGNVIHDSTFTKNQPVYTHRNAVKPRREPEIERSEKIPRVGEIKSRFRSCSESASDRCDVNSAMNIKMRPPKKRPYPTEFCSSEGDLPRLSYDIPLSQTVSYTVPSVLCMKDRPLTCGSGVSYPLKETTPVSGRHRIHSESEIDSFHNSQYNVKFKNNFKGVSPGFVNAVSNVCDPATCYDGTEHDITAYPNRNRYEHTTSLDKRHFLLDQSGNVLYDAFGTEPILKPSNDRTVESTYSNVRKSKRRNRGQRYMELINEGIIQPSKERLAALKTGSVSDLDESDADDQLSDSFSSDKFKRFSPVTKAAMWSHGDSLPDGVTIAMGNEKRYSTGDFDLEAHIAELPMCSLDSLSRKKRKSPQCGTVKVQISSQDVKLEGKKIKLEPDSDVSSNVISSTQSLPPRLPVKEATSSAPLFGSNKRKARKYSITKLIQVSAFDTASLKDEKANDVEENRQECLLSDVTRHQIPQIILPFSDSGNETETKPLSMKDGNHGAPLEKLMQSIPNWQNACRKLFSSDSSETAGECDPDAKSLHRFGSLMKRSNLSELPDCSFNKAASENVCTTDCDSALSPDRLSGNSNAVTHDIPVYVKSEYGERAKGDNQESVYDSSRTREYQKDTKVEICNFNVDKVSSKVDSIYTTGQESNVMCVINTTATTTATATATATTTTTNNNNVFEKALSSPAVSSEHFETSYSIQSSQSMTDFIDPHCLSQDEKGDNFCSESNVCNRMESNSDRFNEKADDCRDSADNSHTTSNSSRAIKGDNCVINSSLTAKSDILLSISDIVRDNTADVAFATLDEKGDGLVIGCDVHKCELDKMKYSDQNTFASESNISTTPDQNLKSHDISQSTSNLNTESLSVDITMTTTADDSGLGSISDDSGLSNNDEKASVEINKDDEIFHNYDEKDRKQDNMEIQNS